jgi:hypothetical protein
MMSDKPLHPMPTQDPVSGKELVITELTCEESGVVIRGRFEIPRYARIDAEQARFLETFLRCRGMLNSVEKQLGVSYPTVRSRLDALLEALDLPPAKEDAAKREKMSEKRRKILEQLEKGEISPDEAKEQIRTGARS